MINLPSGSYNNVTSAIADSQGFANFAMPREFNIESSTGFLISCLVVRQGAT